MSDQSSVSTTADSQTLLSMGGPPIDLWPLASAPSADQQADDVLLLQADDVIVRNVVRPTLVPYLPDPGAANGTAVIVAPGGGFHFLSYENEGMRIASWLAERGIAAFILRYRLVDTGPSRESFAAAMSVFMDKILGEALELGGVDVPSMAPHERLLASSDGEQAVRIVRSRADEWGLDPTRIGMLGFSAGAFVSSATALSEDSTARPDFVGLVYGGHVSTRVDDNAPPLFAVVTADDLLCRRTCIDTARAWVEAGRPAELHVFETGGHGFGSRTLGLPVDGWFDLYTTWLEAHGLLASR